MASELKRSRDAASNDAASDDVASDASSDAPSNRLGTLLSFGEPDAALAVLRFLSAVEVVACDDAFGLPKYSRKMNGSEVLLSSLVSRARLQCACKFCGIKPRLPVYGSSYRNPLEAKTRREISAASSLLECKVCNGRYCRWHAVTYCENCKGVVCSLTCSGKIGYTFCDQYGCRICHVCSREEAKYPS